MTLFPRIGSIVDACWDFGSLRPKPSTDCIAADVTYVPAREIHGLSYESYWIVSLVDERGHSRGNWGVRPVDPMHVQALQLVQRPWKGPGLR